MVANFLEFFCLVAAELKACQASSRVNIKNLHTSELVAQKAFEPDCQSESIWHFKKISNGSSCRSLLTGFL